MADKSVVFQQTRKRFTKKKPMKPVSSEESSSSSDDEEFEKVMKKNFGEKDKVARKKGDAKTAAKAPKRTTKEAEFVDSSDEEGMCAREMWWR